MGYSYLIGGAIVGAAITYGRAMLEGPAPTSVAEFVGVCLGGALAGALFGAIAYWIFRRNKRV